MLVLVSVRPPAEGPAPLSIRASLSWLVGFPFFFPSDCTRFLHRPTIPDFGPPLKALSLSTAICLWAGPRWAYLMVIWMLACPNKSATVRKSAPVMTNRLANVWRRSCHVKSLSLASRAASSNQCRKPRKGSPWLRLGSTSGCAVAHPELWIAPADSSKSTSEKAGAISHNPVSREFECARHFYGLATYSQVNSFPPATIRSPFFVSTSAFGVRVKVTPNR